jgi:acetylornithine deacetylase/succinyl-diaminopimelate desuccinylase-like protein
MQQMHLLRTCVRPTLLPFLAASLITPNVLLSLTAAENPPSEEQKSARDIFRELIEINSTHAYGSTRAAEAMAARLKAAGFPDSEVQVLGARPEKGNLVARLHGTGTAKPILFLAHLDVVEAKPEDWSVDPFKFTEQDGWFYGRGTSDVKNEDADLVANFIRLRQEGFKPNRDLILALTADEESGGDANGVRWLLKEHRELIECAFCVNTDAGGGQIKNGRGLANTVQTGEKIYLSFALEVRNKGGHSSLPVKDNAIYHLAKGLSRLADFDFPIRVNETVRTYFARMGEIEKGTLAADMRAIGREPTDGAAATRLCAASAYYNALLRTTAVATQLSGGHAENALPQAARAVVNSRILPEDSPDEVEKTLRGVLGDEQIEVKRIEEPVQSASSPLDPIVMEPLERITHELWPGLPVIPEMSTGATDGLHLRHAGIPVYGVSGMFFDVDDVRAHGRNERIGVNSFYEGVEFMYRFIKALASK